jgi:proteic killer suppression protein
MIKTFKSKALRLFWEEGNARRLPVKQTVRVQIILAALDAATQPNDLVALEGYRWHPLGKMRPGYYAVEASANYRITYRWDGDGPADVDIEDYH